MENLTGGREDAIYRQGDAVHRPAQPWTITIHTLLKSLYQQGFTQCPTPIALSDTQETLTYVDGATYNYPLEGPIASHEALVSAAKLLRRLHDASVPLLEESWLQERSYKDNTWMLPIREPVEVISHGDFTPYNVALDGNTTVGVFDFDTAHPAPRVWELAYSIYCWAPFKTDEYDKLGELPDQIARAKAFCDAYGARDSDKQALVDNMIMRLENLVAYMKQQAQEGNKQFAANIADGHHLAYEKDIAYLVAHRNEITSKLF
ncbi:aminoglycoside phosphotransferase family protein [Vibrio mexicanus]|uniref:phosphotransferase n=1 Tax=Vibrio mexicanus TaxID=1004326 RepID=UPI00063C11AB|nr:aminoglycoside phosphotransferase family protein [Vibrio mexicanus]